MKYSGAHKVVQVQLFLFFILSFSGLDVKLIMSLWLNKCIHMFKKCKLCIFILEIFKFHLFFSALLLLKLLKIVLSVKPQGDSDGFHEHVGRNRWYEVLNTR